MPINDVQRLVLEIISSWSRSNKKPITQKTILTMVVAENAIPQSTVKAAVRTLVLKGYIRRGFEVGMPACYVQLRTI